MKQRVFHIIAICLFLGKDTFAINEGVREESSHRSLQQNHLNQERKKLPSLSVQVVGRNLSWWPWAKNCSNGILHRSCHGNSNDSSNGNSSSGNGNSSSGNGNSNSGNGNSSSGNENSSGNNNGGGWLGGSWGNKITSSGLAIMILGLVAVVGTIISIVYKRRQSLSEVSDAQLIEDDAHNMYAMEEHDKKKNFFQRAISRLTCRSRAVPDVIGPSIV